MKNRDLAALFVQYLLGTTSDTLDLTYLNRSQNNCASELLRIVGIFGGALLADPVGAGKTRIAIALAANFNQNETQNICVIGPARVRTHWISEAEKCGGFTIEFYSHAFLSQNKNLQPKGDFIIVDEAHRFRNPKAKRSIHLKMILDSRLCLLVSATPFVNREADVITLIRYFLDDEDARKKLGVDPNNASQEDLKSLLYALCIRRGYEDIPTLNTLQIEYELSDEELSFWRRFPATLAEIHFEALKHEWSDQLVRHFLSQQFRYGFAALEASLKSIVRYCEEWLLAAENNLGMNRPFFLNAFPNGQLPLAFMYPEARRGESDTVREDLTHLRSMVAILASFEKNTRDEAIVEASLGSEKMLIFTSRIDVAESLFRRCLAANLRVGMVHSKRALMSGIGKAEPCEIVSKFRDTNPISRCGVRILIATDCLSEGISFPECSNLILVDIPDTAVRIEQRIGRISRINSMSKISKIYGLNPSNADGLSQSTFAKRKSEKSTQLGFRYALAAKLLDAPKNVEDPFSYLLECRDILASVTTPPSSIRPGTHFSVKGKQTNISSITLVRFREGKHDFSFHWVASQKSISDKNILTTKWSDVRDVLMQLSYSDNECVEHDGVQLSDDEKRYFDTLIGRRNLIRFRPSPKQTHDSLPRRLAQKLAGFALSTEETQHLDRVLYSPFSRGRRLRFEALVRADKLMVLRSLLDIKVYSISKLTYDIVLRIDFDFDSVEKNL